MLDVRRLRLLCDLSRLGTIAAVAQAHTYTPSAVSQQLSALERETGAALLERSGRRVVLTTAGRILVRHGETVLAALEEAGAALAAATAGLSGPLRIGVFPTAVRTVLTPALVELGRRHPALELMVTELDPVAAPNALLDQRLDVALLHDYEPGGGKTRPGLETVPLLDETVYLAVPAGVDAAGVRELRDAAWVLASPGTLCHTATVQVCRAAGFVPRARHHADDFATVLALVAAGQGVSLVPQLAITEHGVSLAPEPVVAGQDVSSAIGRAPEGVRLIELSVRRRTRIAYRQGAAGHPAIAAFITAVHRG